MPLPCTRREFSLPIGVKLTKEKQKHSQDTAREDEGVKTRIENHILSQ